MGLSSLNTVLNIAQDESFKKNLTLIEKTFKNFIENISKHKIVNKTRIKGMLACIDIKKEKTFDYFLSNGTNVISRDKSIILAPALTYSNNDLIRALTNLERSLNEA